MPDLSETQKLVDELKKSVRSTREKLETERTEARANYINSTQKIDAALQELQNNCPHLTKKNGVCEDCGAVPE